MKRCSGSCGLELALTEFHRNARGNPQGVCKDCHRDVARESARRSYARHRVALCERKREAYAGADTLTEVPAPRGAA